MLPEIWKAIKAFCTQKIDLSCSADTSRERWKIIAGFLLGLSVLIMGSFTPGFRRGGPPLAKIFPWLTNAFYIVIPLTIFAVAILWHKERNIKKEDPKESISSSKGKSLNIAVRILAGLSGLVFLSLTILTCLIKGFLWWVIIIIFGGYSIMLLWISLTGKDLTGKTRPP